MEPEEVVVGGAGEEEEEEVVQEQATNRRRGEKPKTQTSPRDVPKGRTSISSWDGLGKRKGERRNEGTHDTQGKRRRRTGQCDADNR